MCRPMSAGGRWDLLIPCQPPGHGEPARPAAQPASHLTSLCASILLKPLYACELWEHQIKLEDDCNAGAEARRMGSSGATQRLRKRLHQLNHSPGCEARVGGPQCG